MNSQTTKDLLDIELNLPTVVKDDLENGYRVRTLSNGVVWYSGAEGETGLIAVMPDGNVSVECPISYALSSRKRKTIPATHNLWQAFRHFALRDEQQERGERMERYEQDLCSEEDLSLDSVVARYHSPLISMLFSSMKKTTNGRVEHDKLAEMLEEIAGMTERWQDMVAEEWRHSENLKTLIDAAGTNNHSLILHGLEIFERQAMDAVQRGDAQWFRHMAKSVQSLLGNKKRHMRPSIRMAIQEAAHECKGPPTKAAVRKKLLDNTGEALTASDLNPCLKPMGFDWLPEAPRWNVAETESNA